MMAKVPLTSSSLLPLLESLEDTTVGPSEQTDAYLTIASRLSGDEGRLFLPAVVKHFSRLGKTLQTHITSQTVELSQAALQALGFCVFHTHVVSAIPASFAEELLSALSSLVVKSTDKNTCTRALWVVSKQNFPPEVVAKKVPELLVTLESVRTREDIQSVVMEHEALNVVIRLLEQAPVQMGEGALRWARLVIPLVVHSASKVRLRAAVALEMGMPLLLAKQQEVAAIIEPMMSTKLVPELQKLFSSKNETNVLKLWPLFVRLLGKLLHRGGPFINSLLHLEELGFRSSSPNIKKIAFIAWKSLIDNFALNPDILSSGKRLKLLMQPLSSIQVRTEALLLTKLEVWWYLMVRLGPNMAANFEQVGVPLLQCTLGPDSPSVATPAKGSSQSGAVGTSTPKTGPAGFGSPAVTPRMNLNSSVHAVQSYPSVQLLGLEMLLHYFLGPEVNATAARNKLVLSLEPLSLPLVSSPSSFTKHASQLICLVRDGFITIGKDAPDALLTLLWKNLVSHVSSTIDAAGNKKDRHGCEVLTLMLHALQSIVSSEALSVERILGLLETTVRGLPHRVLGSASYQVGKMDVLNGTPALFLIQLVFSSSLVSAFMEDERFFLCLETLVGCGLSGPTSPLAFGEAVLGAMGRPGPHLGNKEQLWRVWSVVVHPLTETITQTNEVNQGDALEHNFSAVHAALMFPVSHLLPGQPLPQMTQKSLLSSWSRLYKVFACCSALVATAEENVCCEELCAKMAAVLDTTTLVTPSILEAVAHILLVIIESVDFSPYTTQFQQKMKSPHTPLTWVKKKRALGNLFSFHSLLVQSLETFAALEGPEAASEGTGLHLVSVLSCLFTSLALATAIREALGPLTPPLSLLYRQAARSQDEQPKFSSNLLAKMEKLLAEVLGCLQMCSSLAYDDDLLVLLSPLLCVLFPHRSKHVRSLTTQFWNATFANTHLLTYPDQLIPVLSQVKQNTPIILPGFQAVDVPDDLSGQYSSENSQLETKLSGVQVSSVGKRDSLLARTGELTQMNTKTTSKSVSTKLDFGSPKPPRREVLEEEASVDFVFIPPETKERVLTEHQKEVKRTKRTDIPAMYNNLDASLDTTVFSQYSQSQEESIDKLPTDDQADEAAKDGVNTEVQEESMEVEDVPELLTKETQDYVCPTASDHVCGQPGLDERPTEEMPTESPDVSMEEADRDVLLEDSVTEPKDTVSPNVSASSDMVSGTPQKPNNSRRQSFITLEKYAERKPASPISGTKFTGPLSRTSNSQDPSSPHLSQPEAGPESPVPLGDAGPQSPAHLGDVGPQSSTPQTEAGFESPALQGDASGKSSAPPTVASSESPAPQVEAGPESPTPQVEASPLTHQGTQESPKHSSNILSEQPSLQQNNREGSQNKDYQKIIKKGSFEATEDGEDIIPDTQAEAEKRTPVFEGADDNSLGEEPEALSDGSLSSQDEPRRSGRRRSRPQKPGDDPEEGDEKEKQTTKAKRLSQSDSQTTTLTPVSHADSQSLGRSSRSSRLGVEVVEGEGTDKTQRKAALRGLRGHTKEERSPSDSQLKNLSATETPPSLGKRSLRSHLALEAEEEAKLKRRTRSSKELSSSSQRDSRVGTGSRTQSQGRASRRSKLVSDSEEFDLIDQSKKQVVVKAELSQDDSQVNTPSSAAQTESQSQGRPSRRSKVVSESQELVRDGPKRSRRSNTEDQLSQSDSPMTTPSATQPDSQSQGRPSRKCKVNSKLEEPVKEEQSCIEGRDDKPSKSASQTVTPSSAAQPDSQSQGRRSGRSKVSDEVDKSPNLAGDSVEQRTNQTDSQLTPSTGGQREGQVYGGRPRRLKLSEQQVDPSNSLSSTEEDQNSQVTDEAGTQESSQGRGKSTRWRTSQGFSPNVENSGASETREVQKTNKRGRKSKFSESTSSPLNVDSGKPTADGDISMDDSEPSQMVDPQITPIVQTKTPKEVEDLHKSQDSPASTLPLVSENAIEQGVAETQMLMEEEVLDSVNPVIVQEKAESENTKPSSQTVPAVQPDLDLKDSPVRMSPRKNECSQKLSGGRSQTSLSQEHDLDDSGSTVPSLGSNVLLDDNVFMEPNQLCTPPLSNGLSSDTSPPTDRGEIQSLDLQTSEPSEQKNVDVPQPVEEVTEDKVLEEEEADQDKENLKPSEVSEEQYQDNVVDRFTGDVQAECSGLLAEEEDQFTSIKESHPESEGSSTRDKEEVEGEAQVDEDVIPPHEEDQASGIQCDDEIDEETQIDNDDLNVAVGDVGASPSDVPAAQLPVQTTDMCQDSPVKRRGLEVLGKPDVGDSPSSSKTKGVWSPSASPSTSILKKGQKRPLEVETPSPLIKSRRVSFADPIQHQELADDIDRRSPVIRTSSPRSKHPSSIPQPKYITTPTKGLLILSPRNLRSPGYKSSKKCLISEMGKEPRAIPKDCVYPALVSCSAPVEAVLPQIASNMWPRGFGQLVRAQNIKTVGDLSALTPNDIKKLPIRSPKILNVKKALRTYFEHQRKGRGDELKSFDEMEKMTSEVEDMNDSKNQEDDDRSPGEALATELLDDSMVLEQHDKPQLDQRPKDDGPEGLPRDERPPGLLRDERPPGLLSEMEVLGARMTPEELGCWSAEQLLQMHDQLGGMMRNVVVQLQTRLTLRDGQP